MVRRSSFHRNKYRPQTEKKLRILRKYMGPWIDIWSSHAHCAEWFILDVFAGSGESHGHHGTISGSPLVILEEVLRRRKRLEAHGRHITFIMIEKEKVLADLLTATTGDYVSSNGLSNLVTPAVYCGDCDTVLQQLLPRLHPPEGAPALIFVDPCNTDISRDTFEAMLDMPWREDVLFNYMVSAVKRDVGCMAAGSRGSVQAEERLSKCFGPDAPSTQEEAEDPSRLATPLFCSRGHKVVVFYMEYPDRREVQYYLMFASKNDTVKKIVRQIYAKECRDRYGQGTLFGADEFLVNMTILE